MSQIETTRRAMYALLANVQHLAKQDVPKAYFQSNLNDFEESIEEHLEALRKDSESLKAQVSKLNRKKNALRADRSKYRQWMRSAVRQNRAERKNVKAFRETQDELVAEIERMRREMPYLRSHEELRAIKEAASNNTPRVGMHGFIHRALNEAQEPKQ